MDFEEERGAVFSAQRHESAELLAGGSHFFHAVHEVLSFGEVQERLELRGQIYAEESEIVLLVRFAASTVIFHVGPSLLQQEHEASKRELAAGSEVAHRL